MGVIAKGIPRGCQGLFTPVSLGYPLSVFNKNSTLKQKKRSKHFKRWYRGMLPHTMVDSWYCLDQVVPEGMSQVSRRSEVAYINGAPSTPGYLLALLR